MVVHLSEWCVYIVAEAVVDREPSLYVPVVLSKQAWLPHPVIWGKQDGTPGHSGKGDNQEWGQVACVLVGSSTIFLEPKLIAAIGVIALDLAGLSPDQRGSGLDGVLAKSVGYGSVVLKGIVEVLQRDEPAISKGLYAGKLNEGKAGG